MKLYYNPDPTMEAVTLFEETSVRGRQHSVIKDASRYPEEFLPYLKLEYPEAMCVTDDDKYVNGKKMRGAQLRRARKKCELK